MSTVNNNVLVNLNNQLTELNEKVTKIILGYTQLSTVAKTFAADPDNTVLAYQLFNIYRDFVLLVGHDMGPDFGFNKPELIVPDIPEMKQYFTRMLELCGYSVDPSTGVVCINLDKYNAVSNR